MPTIETGDASCIKKAKDGAEHIAGRQETPLGADTVTCMPTDTDYIFRVAPNLGSVSSQRQTHTVPHRLVVPPPRWAQRGEVANKAQLPPGSGAWAYRRVLQGECDEIDAPNANAKNTL